MNNVLNKHVLRKSCFRICWQEILLRNPVATRKVYESRKLKFDTQLLFVSSKRYSRESLVWPYRYDQAEPGRSLDLFISRSLISCRRATFFQRVRFYRKLYTSRNKEYPKRERWKKRGKGKERERERKRKSESETTFAGMTLTSRRYLCDHLFYYRAEPKQFIPAFTI